ncbi:MAG: DJ-1/PfpI family protein [Rhodospirillales bacterium]|nr:MAG: DJ-1/PfpI family protein [Rhodospirillales bacterium]
MDIVFLFYDGMTTLDAIGPWEVLSRLPGARAFPVARDGGAVTTDTGLKFDGLRAMADVARADVLVVPGAGDVRPQVADPRTLDWLRAVDATTRWTTSVCTGAVILAAAGLLKDRRATTHWAAMNALRRLGAMPVEQRVVEHGKYVTAAGVSAGIDMALTLAARLVDEPTARALQLAIEYAPDPPFDAGTPASAGPETMARALALLAANAPKP